MPRFKTTIALLVIILFSTGEISAEVKELKRICYYPQKNDDLYFRVISDLEIIEDEIYAVANHEHKILVFKFEDYQIKHIRDIGRHGKGPGDLIRPARLSIWNHEIAVRSQNSFSFFNRNGNFLSRFKMFISRNLFVYLDNKIYWLNSKLEETHLIEVYTKEGERMSTFGKKFLSIDPLQFKIHIFLKQQCMTGTCFLT